VARRLLALALVLGVTGCTLGPDFRRPDVPAPPNWREIPVAEAENLANTAWWDLFDDPQLQELIRIALVENKDLKIAVERIEEARARYGFAKADFWPQINQGAAGGKVRFTEGSLVHTPDGDDVGSGDAETRIFSVSADVSWELDFFGRIRRTTESQKALLLGTQEARRSAVLALVADVARAYFELCDFDRRLAIARRTIESRRDYVVLARDRFEGGVTPEIDFRQAEAELKRVETVVFDLERLIAAKENELSVLLGRNPGSIVRGRPVEEQKLPAAVPAGLPSDLLDRRPDVREAEQVLASATANIGAAKALLFPRFALTGSYGWASTDFDDLFESSAKSWNIIGNQLQPIFDAGKNRRRLEVTESQQRQTLYQYERTVLQAFRETEDALVAYRKTGEQRQAQAARVTAERKVLELAELRYRGGVANYLEVLDAQRSLFGAELDETATIGAHLVGLVKLYKALGGGWSEEPTAMPASAAAPPPR
jgi:multidrug efflux system outer membrane protein